MTSDRFDLILNARLTKTREVLAAKRREYATPADLLHNFVAAAERRGTTKADALLGMLVKHWVSIEGIVSRDYLGMVDHATIDEKIGDAVNYLVLLEAILKERP